MTRVLLDHLRRQLGDEAVAQLLVDAGETRAIEVLLDDSSWSSYGQFRALLEAAADALGGTDELRRVHETVALDEGSMPEGTEALQTLGSPSVLFESVAEAGICTVIEGVNEQVHDDEWLLGWRFVEGFEPFPAFCAFFSGLTALGPRLFGRRILTLDDETCELRGDPWCSVRLAWSASDDGSAVSFLETKLRVAERRMEALQQTVGDLVSTDDLPTVLGRVVASAARAARANAFVLALRPLPYVDDLVHAQGMPAEAATDLARRLLSGDVAHHDDRQIMAVEVVSKQRSYGWLAAVDPIADAAGHERVLLEAYARLAATALDSAIALEESRRQAASAQALLHLSAALAEVTTSEEMSANVARAISLVLDCDASAVSVVEGDTIRITATDGFDADVAAMLRSTSTPVRTRTSDEIELVGIDDADEDVAALMQLTGMVAYARVPMVIDGAVVGYVVASVASDPKRLFGDPELHGRLHGLAAQASAALRNANLVDQIRHQAMHDPLTGLPNRALVLDRAEFLLQRARRQGTAVAALFLDLDGFKEVNDGYGHAVGDHLLRGVAGRIGATLRECDTIARLGGDEFVVLTECEAVDHGPELVAGRLVEALREPFVVPDCEVPLLVTTSIGIAVATEGTAAELLHDADTALYRTKASGKDAWTRFAPEMHQALRQRLDLEAELRGALGRGELVVAYRPVLDRTDAVRAAAAVLGWHHPTLGEVPPAVFLPILEQAGVGDDVGRWVIVEACRQAVVWHGLGHPITVSVRLSARQFHSDHLVGDVAGALTTSGLPPASLVIEVAGSTVLGDLPLAARQLAGIRPLGVGVALDESGPDEPGLLTAVLDVARLLDLPVGPLDDRPHDGPTGSRTAHVWDAVEPEEFRWLLVDRDPVA